MILKNFTPYIGQHCETTTTGTLLNQLGIELSEPMIFGLGEGLGYIFWKMKSMDFPFIGGRIKTDLLTENVCKNLELKLDVRETSSLKKAWANVEAPLRQGKAVGLKLDCYHLEYFSNKIHFAGHYVAMYGYDDKFAYLVDTEQQGKTVKTTLKNLALARNEKGSMSSRNRSYIIDKIGELPNMKMTIRRAIHNNVVEYLNPPIKNITYKGIEKTAMEIKKWFRTSQDIKGEFQTSAMLMERAGTGGALFRNLFRDFLKESFEKYEIEGSKTGYEAFEIIASKWTEISELFDLVGHTRDEKYLNEASKLFLELSILEKQAMENLGKACGV